MMTVMNMVKATGGPRGCGCAREGQTGAGRGGPRDDPAAACRLPRAWLRDGERERALTATPDEAPAASAPTETPPAAKPVLRKRPLERSVPIGDGHRVGLQTPAA
jgi:hypothetical protein